MAGDLMKTPVMYDSHLTLGSYRPIETAANSDAPVYNHLRFNPSIKPIPSSALESYF